ncbi:MAG: restriction endonuclease subunit S [Acetatifactor sp.]|nr:restriction endonuclease subunit S [Acetatifactor sp.]
MNNVKIGTLIREISDKTTCNNQYEVLTSSQRGIVSQEEYFNKQIASQDNTGYKIIKHGQFTYRSMSDTGKFYINRLIDKEIGIVSPAYPVFEIVSDEIMPEYLELFFKSNSFQRQISGKSNGSTRLALKYKKLEAVNIELPTLDIQKEIIGRIAKIRKSSEKCLKQMQLLEELVSTRFIELFADDLKRGGLTIRDIAEDATVGIANSATHAYSESGVVLLRNQNIRVNYLDDDDLIHITPEFAAKYENKRLQEDDILITRTGANVGMACLVPKEYEGCQTFTTLILRLKPDAGLTPTFVCHYINSPLGKAFIEKKKVGGAQPNFGVKQLVSMPIAIPSKEKQEQFINLIERVGNMKNQTRNMYDKYSELFEKKMDEVFVI